MCISWFNFITGLNFSFFCFKLIVIHYRTKKDKIEPEHMIYYASQSIRRTFSDNMELHVLYVRNLEIAYSVFSLEVDGPFQLLLERDPL